MSWSRWRILAALLLLIAILPALFVALKPLSFKQRIPRPASTKLPVDAK